MAAQHRLLVLAAAVLFSTGGAAIKATDLDGWEVAGFRSGVAALALFAVVPAWRRFWEPRTLLCGLSYGATMVLFVIANKLTSAAATIFLQSTAPLYLLLLAPWLLKERIRPRDLPFAAALLVGMSLFFVGLDAPSSTAPDPLTGNLLAAAAGATWAVTILGLRWLGRSDPRVGHDPAGAAVVAGNLIACLVCLPLALPLAEASNTDLALVIYLGLFQIGLAYVALTRGVRAVPAFEASLLLLAEPVLSPIWAWLVHGERPGDVALIGCIVILVATVAHSLRR